MNIDSMENTIKNCNEEETLNNDIKHALSEGLKVLMRKLPLEKITVGDICRESAVGRRSFYRYFPDKYELLNWTYYDSFLYMFDDKSIKHTLLLYPYVCANLYEDRLFYLNAFDVKGQNSFRDYCMKRLYPYMLRDYGDACQSDAERDFYITRILDAVFDDFQRWLSSEPCMPPREYVEKTMNSILRFSTRFAAVALSVSEHLYDEFDEHINKRE